MSVLIGNTFVVITLLKYVELAKCLVHLARKENAICIVVLLEGTLTCLRHAFFGLAFDDNGLLLKSGGKRFLQK